MEIYLGQLLKLKKGDKVKIKLVNNLDENTTFHWHGLEIDGKWMEALLKL